MNTPRRYTYDRVLSLLLDAGLSRAEAQEIAGGFPQ